MLDRNLDREASDKLAAERVLKARTELILARRFYGVLVSQVDPVLSRSFPTAATNGKKHFFNPDFVSRLSQDELLTVQAHESEHDARHHGTRRGDRDPKKWNEAADYAINIDLVDEGFKFPSEEVLGGKPLIDEKYRGMSAEDIYRSRELDEKAEQEKQRQQEQDDDENDNGQDDESDPGDDADTDPGNGEQDSDDDDQDGDQGEPQDGDQDEDDGDQEGGDADQDDGDDQDDGQGDDGDEAEDDQDDGQGGQGKPTGEPEADDQGEGQGGAPDDAQDGQDGQGGGDGQGDPQDGTEGQGQGGGEPSEGDAEDQGEEPVSTGDFPGSLGEVLDSAEDAGELSNEDTRWERVVRQAAALAKGDAPGHVSREIERSNAPAQDWREVLRAWIDHGTKRVETWSRPNRRFVGSGVILPGSQRDGVNKVVVVVDTSGSMDDIALACVNKEVQAALDEGAIDELVVIYNDVRVTKVDEYHAGDEVEFTPYGGGGTDLKPAFSNVRENIEDVSGMLIFSDMEIGDPGPEPECPVLWAATGYPNSVKAHLANTPWGAPGIDVGSH